MDLDEIIYSRVAKFLQFRKKEAIASLPQLAKLETLRFRLKIIASAVSGKNIEIYPAEKEGGYRNDNFFLPEQISFFPDYTQNVSFYLFRTIYLCVQSQKQLNWKPGQNKTETESFQVAMSSAPQVLTEIETQFPAVMEIHHELSALIPKIPQDSRTNLWHFMYGKWMENQPEEKTREKQNPHKNSRKKIEDELRTILKARAVEEIKVIEVDKKTQEDYVMTHNFEKVETAEEFNGIWRDFDGEDELKDHADALNELSMKYAVRVDETTHSVLHADFQENTNIAESTESASNPETCITYPEWDYKKKIYKPDFARVYPELFSSNDEDYFKKTLSEHRILLGSLRKMLTSLNNKRQQVRRLNQGEDFDMESLVDLYTDIHSGHSPDEKIYLSSRKREKDISITLLLDLSLSSDGYSDNNRIIDVEKQVAILFGEILNEFFIDFSVAGFYSNTRNFTAYLSFKTFEEKWEKARFSIGGVQPSGYTRIGAAIRHAGSLLKTRKTANKWLILLSDGKPNDFDRYEGKYGIEDVRQALKELSSENIQAYAFAIESSAKFYLPQMFGENHFQILSSPDNLILSLVKLYERIRALS